MYISIKDGGSYYIPANLSRSEQSLRRRSTRSSKITESDVVGGIRNILTFIAFVASVLALFLTCAVVFGPAPLESMVISWGIVGSCIVVCGIVSALEKRITEAPQRLVRSLGERIVPVYDPGLMELSAACQSSSTLQPRPEDKAEAAEALFHQILNDENLTDDYLARTAILRELLREMTESESIPFAYGDEQTIRELHQRLREEAKLVVDVVSRDMEEASRVIEEAMVSHTQAAATMWLMRADLALGRVRNRAT